VPGTGTVLAVDSDPLVLGTLACILDRSSFSVKTALSAREALRMLEGPHDIGLIISEVVMPEMSGIDLLEKIKAMSPDTPVILMTGDSDQAIGPDTPFLAKPFTAQALRERVEEVLACSREVGAANSTPGCGATMENTRRLRAELNQLWAERWKDRKGAHRALDAGTMFWPKP